MNSDDWRGVDIPDERLEFWKLEHYSLTDSVTGAEFLITWHDGPDSSPFSLADLQNPEDFDSEMRLALETGATDGHFGGRKDNLNDTIKKVWNNIQQARALKERRESPS